VAIIGLRLAVRIESPGKLREYMGEIVKIVECPRDAWQGLPSQIPTELKAQYLQKLIDTGFRHIDAVSFVSPAAVPQMADAEQVLTFLELNEDVEIIGIVVNAKGAERAIETIAVHTLGFPYSISPQFLERNQHQTPEESLDALEAIGTLAYKADMNLVAYISMAFGNPYGDAWSIDEVVNACDLLIESGVRHISLADTVGLATPALISETVSSALAIHDAVEIGVHLHARPEESAAKVRAAYESGCRRFDSAIGGLGGCPFAQDVMVGNIPTETLLSELERCGAYLPKLGSLSELKRMTAEIGRQFGGTAQ
jgi:hydroxymethylglutaryl-CoA lyase